MGPAFLPLLPRTQSNEAEEQPQEEQPGEQQAQQPFPPAAAIAAGAPGWCRPPWAPANAAANATTATFKATAAIMLVVAVVFCEREGKAKVNTDGSYSLPSKFPGFW